jgi:hypothetical protein
MRRRLKLAISALGMCVLAASLSIFCAGCAQNKVHAAAPVTVPPVPPSPVPTQDTSKSPASIPAPTTPAPVNPASTTSASSPPLNSTPDSPKKPVTAPPASSEPERPAAPQISPQISASDQSQLQQQANQYVANAGENLHKADGRNLNATQKDMVDKIRGFLDQAQQAIQTSDWQRAKNLSQKAYLLSLDLVKTL